MTKRPIPAAYLSVREVAQHFGCGASTIYRWVKSGVIPHPVKLGGLTRWRRADIEALTEREAA